MAIKPDSTKQVFQKKLIPFDIQKWPIVKAMAKESGLGVRRWFDVFLDEMIERRNKRKQMEGKL